MYSVRTIANYFILKGIEEQDPVTPLKLLSMVYISNGLYLGVFKKSLVDDLAEAWEDGPVYKDLYHEIKYFAGEGITMSFPRKDYEHARIIEGDDKFACEILKSVWEGYKEFDGGQLTYLLRREGSPWYKVWYEQGVCMCGDCKIPSYLIQQFYTGEIYLKAGRFSRFRSLLKGK